MSFLDGLIACNTIVTRDPEWPLSRHVRPSVQMVCFPSVTYLLFSVNQVNTTAHAWSDISTERVPPPGLGVQKANCATSGDTGD